MLKMMLQLVLTLYVDDEVAPCSVDDDVAACEGT